MKMEKNDSSAPQRKESNGKALSMEKKELFVEYSTDRRTGCYLSRFQVSCLILGNLLILCTAVALVAFVKKERIIYSSMADAFCSCETPRPNTNVTSEYYYVRNQTSVVTLSESLTEVENSTSIEKAEESKVDSDYEPWREIRLSGDLMPILYEIDMKVDLSNLTYKGRVDMFLKCTKNTHFVIFHISQIFLTRKSVKVMEKDTLQELEIAKQFRYIRNQFWVIELLSELSAGTVYRVSVGYRGHLHEDLRGIYLSKYVTPEGETR